MKAAARYFCWLSFANTVIIAGQMLRIRRPAFDYLAAWALMGVYLLIALLFISLVLAAFNGVCRKTKMTSGATFIEAAVFALVPVSWINFLRMIFLSHGIHSLWLPARVLLLSTFVLGMVFFPWARKKFARQLSEITLNMGIVSGVVLAFWLLSLSAFAVHSSHDSLPHEPVPLSKNAAAPNIIYIVLDAMCSRDMSVYGYSLKTTPHMDALAKTWTIYENANSAGTGTMANMPAVLTGRYPVLKPWSLYGELAGRVKGWLNLPEILRAHGYETIFLNGGGIHPNFFHFQNSFDDIITAGAGWYLKNDPLTWCARLPPAIWNRWVGKNIPLDGILPYPYTMGKTELVEPMYGQIEKALRRRDLQKGERPFFLYMHMLRPHAPYLANEFAGTFLPLSAGFQTFSSQLHFLNFPQVYTPAEQTRVNQLRLRYDENILKADAEVAEFLTMLKKENLYESSLIIITADHGTSFTNGYVGYYTPVVSASEHSIPLLVKFPHQTLGRRIQGLVSTVDILPTILSLLKVAYSAQDVDGQPLQTAGDDQSRVIYVCNAADPSHSFAALSKNLKIVQSNRGRTLFDLKHDPQEQLDLRGRVPAPALENALERFSKKIAAAKEAARS